MTTPTVCTRTPITSGDAPTSAQMSNYAPTLAGGGAPVREASDWRQRGACISADPELFFPLMGGRTQAAEAIEVCKTCTVRAECLTWALANGPMAGVWGGTSARTRARMTRREA